MKTTAEQIDHPLHFTGHRLNSLLAVVAGILFFQNAQAVVSLPYYDGFDYAEGNLNAVDGVNWAAGNGTSTLEISVSSAAALTAPPGYPAESGKGVRRAPSGSSRRSVLQYTTIPQVDGNAVYVSFLLNVQTVPGSAQLIGYIHDGSGSDTAPQAGIFLDEGPKLRVGKNQSAGSAGFIMATNLGTGTHLVVVRYLFQAGNDQVDLWVDPSSSDYGAGAAPTSLGNAISGSDASTLAYFQIYSPGSAGGLQYIDEFRVGTTWADVVPSGGPLTGVKLGFTTQPANAAVGATINPVVVQVQSANGASVASNNVPVTLTLTGGSGTLNGTLTQNTDSSGKATFNDLSIDTAGTGKQLTASASGIGTGLTNAVSASFSITNVPLGKKLTFTTQPADTQVNATMSAVVVQIQDENGISAASNNVPITLTLTSGSGILGGTTTQNTDASGKATFNNLSIDTAGAGKQLTASASGIGTGLTNTASSTFSITTPPAATKLGITTQPADAIVNATMPAVVVQVQQVNGTSVSSNNVPITLTLTSGSGTLNGTTTQNTDSSGKATFNDLSIDIAGAGKQLTASASGIGTGLTNAVSSAFSILNPPPPNGPVITQTVKTSDSIILRGTNGTASANFQVLNSTNLTLLTTLWASIGTNAFDAGGNFDCTNAFSSPAPVNYFRISTLAPPPLSDEGSNGYATIGGITGGGDTTNIIIATNQGQFGLGVSNSQPYIIYVQGTITLFSGANTYIRPNKTIIGLGTNATIVGNLAVFGVGGTPSIGSSNVIIRNLHITNPNQFGEDDGITIKYGGHHVWVDHCTIYDCFDGALDVSRESDFVTVSWCKFFYNTVNSHDDTVNLIGGDDGDTTDSGKLHVTFHHNWYGLNCIQRQPSVRYGRVHVYNNYYNCAGNIYCVRTRLSAEVLTENNYFENVQNPIERLITSGTTGKMFYTNNITVNCTTNTSYDPGIDGTVEIPPSEALTSDPLGLNPPPYPYTLIPAASVPNIVTNNAGAGKGPFAP